MPPASQSFVRPNCPICGSEGTVMLGLAFSHKPHLPDETTLRYCDACDFAYSSPGNAADYAAYYGTTRNDCIHDALATDNATRWVTRQASHVQTLLDSLTPLRVLDYGCGGGDLLRELAKLHPQHHYVGYDVHVPSLDAADKVVAFTSQEPTAGAEKFDLVIFSHVFEHLIDFGLLRPLSGIMSENARLYIEVPDAQEYRQHPRREFLYYIDRLHVNHFSAKAMLTLLSSYGFAPLQYGKYTLPYKDQKEYPAQYFLFQKSAAATLQESIRSYMDAERARPNPLACANPQAPLLIYGFGDHFFRSQSEGGPLAGRKIAGVIDQRAAELNQSDYAKRFRFFNLADALAQFPEATIAVILSWGAEQVAADIGAKASKATVVIV